MPISPPSFRRLFVAALVGLAVVSLSACGSSDSGSDGAKDDTSTTTAKSGGDDNATDSSTTSAGDSDSEAANPGKETLVDGEAAPDKTVTVSADGAFDPTVLTVDAGEKFTFKSAEGTHAVTFNGSDQYTVSGGLVETFTLETPGTYTVTETISEATMTITVTS